MKSSCPFLPELINLSFLLTFFLCSAHSMAWAQWSQTQKLLASDGAASDYLGEQVTMSGNYAIAGAPGENYPHGAAYIYEKNMIGTWHEVAKLTPGTGERFGVSVAISGNLAVVGSYGLDLPEGAASLYKRNSSGIWQFVRKFKSGSTYDGFGHSVGVSGNKIMVSAPNNGDGTGFGNGAVYIFEKTPSGSWLSGVTTTFLTPYDSPGPVFYGNSVAISGNRAIIGASGNLEGEGASAYVYEKNIWGTWIAADKLTPSDPATDNNFGCSVAISGTRALVGASGGLTAGIAVGAAYVFERNLLGHWPQVAKLTASDAALHDGFGFAVSLSGSRAVVGAYGDDESGSASGSAYVFQRMAGIWTEVTELTASDGAAGDWFGRSVGISGYKIIVGAPEDDDSGNSSGAAYIFEHGFQIPSGMLNLKLYPNPNEGIFEVKAIYQGKEEKALLSITDYRGNIILKEEITLPLQQKYDLSRFGKGIYLLKIQAGNTIATQKVMVE